MPAYIRAFWPLPRLHFCGRSIRRERLWLAGGAGALVVAVAGWWLISTRGGPPPHDPAPTIVAVKLPVPPAPRPEHVVEFADGCVTAECHASMSAEFAALQPKSVHELVVRHACGTCHAPDAGGHTYPLVRTADALCSHCHDTGHGGKTFQHKAMFSAEGCLTCHDPHASQGRFLLVGQTVEQTCAQCHPATEGGHRHWPYAKGECSACHEPHGSDTVALLRTNGSGGIEGHCGMCHAETVDAMAFAPYTHRSVEGSCLACHGAHATDRKRLQRAGGLEPKWGCVSCHDDVATTIAGAIVSHDAVLTGDECVACHTPHASANAMMLRDDHRSVCLSCHSEPVLASDGRHIPEMKTAITANPVVHGAIAAGDCASCHSVHGGQHARLLKALNPKVLVGGFDLRNYALCFSCHDQELALSDSREATAFRDGNVNLHRVHLAGERSRSCASCHAAHSSDLPRLIAESVAYDGSPWMMPMGFFLTDDGGGCVPGCHEPLTYSRSRRDAE